jgi:hypothetical protein
LDFTEIQFLRPQAAIGIFDVGIFDVGIFDAGMFDAGHYGRSEFF